MRTLRLLFMTVLFIAAVQQANAQTPLAPQLRALSELQKEVTAHIRSGGRSIAAFGIQNPEDLLGRAVLCSFDPSAELWKPASNPYPIVQSTYYAAQADRLQGMLTIVTQGAVSGNLTAGTLSTDANNEWLTRVTAQEQIRLTLRIDEPVVGGLSRDHILRIWNLDQAAVASSPAKSWCLVDSVSLWNLSRETLRKIEGNISAGFWIVSGRAKYANIGQITIPDQALSFSYQPYSRETLMCYGGKFAQGKNVNDATLACRSPPSLPVAVADFSAVMTASAIEKATNQALPILREARIRELARELKTSEGRAGDIYETVGGDASLQLPTR